MHQDGPRISLRVDLNEYPDKPPRKWIGGKFNRVQLTFVLLDIKNFQVNGWSANNVGKLTLKDCDTGVSLRFAGQSVQIDCIAHFLEVEKISGYYDSGTS